MYGTSFNLNELIDQMSFPASGIQLLSQCHRILPENFCNEIKPRIENKKFTTPQDLEQWFGENLTTHMVKLLGGGSVQELISKERKAI
jgi:hypothetical protein